MAWNGEAGWRLPLPLLLPLPLPLRNSFLRVPLGGRFEPEIMENVSKTTLFRSLDPSFLPFSTFLRRKSRSGLKKAIYRVLARQNVMALRFCANSQKKFRQYETSWPPPPKSTVPSELFLQIRTGFKPRRCTDPFSGTPEQRQRCDLSHGNRENGVNQLARGIPVPNPLPRMPESG